MEKTVLLIYSGGLDTSICIPLMKEVYGFEKVLTVTLDIGQPTDDIKRAEKKALVLADEHYTLDATEVFAKDYCFQAVKANGDYQGYPLSTAIARPLIAAKVVELARQKGINTFAHGCTGKGNDQFRIEGGIREGMPEATILAPIREKNLTRAWELEYAQQNGVPVDQSMDRIWSVDENLWGRSIEGGELENPETIPPESIYAWTQSATQAPDSPEKICLEFDQGECVAIEGEKLSPKKLIETLNSLGGRNGVGRIDIMEDRLIGFKARENYECPAATVLVRAHRALEALVLTKEERAFKTMVDAKWAEIAYGGLWRDPHKQCLEAYIHQAQKRVSGKVWLRLFKGSLTVLARQSPWALYSEREVSFETQTMDPQQAYGLVNYHGYQSQIYHLKETQLGK